MTWSQLIRSGQYIGGDIILDERELGATRSRIKKIRLSRDGKLSIYAEWTAGLIKASNRWYRIRNEDDLILFCIVDSDDVLDPVAGIIRVDITMIGWIELFPKGHPSNLNPKRILSMKRGRRVR